MDAKKMLSSFGLPGTSKGIVWFKTIAEAVRGVKAAHQQGLPAIPLGAGTNCVFLEPKLSAVFLQSRDRSLTSKNVASKTFVTVGAGLRWDTLVKFTVQHSLRGLEYLSGIPGTCGAAPVQNIGAYGAELAEHVESVDVLNLKTLRTQKFSREECGFGYRQSIFNTTERGTFLISSITLTLARSSLATPAKYPELAAKLSARPSLTAVRRLVLATRHTKLPDYKIIPNCGSFFKNPIINPATAAKILKRHPSLPHWPEKNGAIKFSAAWLIDHGNLRDRHWGKISISSQHALVLVNKGDRDHKNLTYALREITATIHKKFGLILKTEPNLFDKNFVNIFTVKQITDPYTHRFAS